MDLLFVCTGNVCRSPLAEQLVRSRAAGLLASTSAGTRATVGAAMDPASAAVLGGWGIDPDGHRARLLDRGTVEDADLVLTMTVEQRTAVLRMAPRVLRRVFTLREAAWRLGLVPALETRPPGTPVGRAAGLAAALDRTRAVARAPGSDVLLDVPDPIGRPPEFHREVGELVADAVLALVEALDLPGESAHPLG
ncbi:MAG: wzb [Klenkia sp.]|nr:wzb [Klenkia sp.]